MFLTKNGYKNNVEFVYSAPFASSYVMKDVASAFYDIQNGVINVTKFVEQTREIASGVLETTYKSINTAVKISELAGVDVTHYEEAFGNKISLKTSLCFLKRGQNFGVSVR